MTSIVLSDSGTSFLRRSIVLLLLALTCFLAWHHTLSIGLSSQWNLGMKMQMWPLSSTAFFTTDYSTLKSSYNSSSAHIFSLVQPMVSIPCSWRMCDPFLVDHLGEWDIEDCLARWYVSILPVCPLAPHSFLASLANFLCDGALSNGNNPCAPRSVVPIMWESVWRQSSGERIPLPKGNEWYRPSWLEEIDFSCAGTFNYSWEPSISSSPLANEAISWNCPDYMRTKKVQLQSRARMPVENAFERLKGRWRCFLKSMDCHLRNVPNVMLHVLYYATCAWCMGTIALMSGLSKELECKELHKGKLIVSRYLAESINELIAGRFGLIGIHQLMKAYEAETSCNQSLIRQIDCEQICSRINQSINWLQAETPCNQLIDWFCYISAHDEFAFIKQHSNEPLQH